MAVPGGPAGSRGGPAEIPGSSRVIFREWVAGHELHITALTHGDAQIWGDGLFRPCWPLVTPCDTELAATLAKASSSSGLHLSEGWKCELRLKYQIVSKRWPEKKHISRSAHTNLGAWHQPRYQPCTKRFPLSKKTPIKKSKIKKWPCNPEKAQRPLSGHLSPAKLVEPTF